MEYICHWLYVSEKKWIKDKKVKILLIREPRMQHKKEIASPLLQSALLLWAAIA